MALRNRHAGGCPTRLTDPLDLVLVVLDVPIPLKFALVARKRRIFSTVLRFFTITAFVLASAGIPINVLT